METQKDGQKPCAPKNKPANRLPGPDLFSPITLEKFSKDVRKLQLRIAKAFREGKPGKVKALQRILTRSLAARTLAVQRVTTNKGKNTPGVDRILWKTPREKTRNVQVLKRRGYTPLPLRRIYIPKKNGKLRPLSIPTLFDRAMQALHLLALIPIAEETADPNSYGFRPDRSTADAIGQCHTLLSRRTSSQWILEGDIKSCFDTISHPWLLGHIPMDKVVLRKWLRAGYIDKRTFFPSMEGTPQGGIASPTMANMVLDGLERILKDRFSSGCLVHVVRYADDFIITGRSKELLQYEVKPVVETFLRERGLILSQEKTRVVHIREGFDFLGQHLQKYANQKVLTKPAKNNVRSFLDKARNILKLAKAKTQTWLIETLNPVIRGWANYHRHIVAKTTFGKVDSTLWSLLWSWLKRRHPGKGRRWIFQQYFQRRGLRNWVFAVPKGRLELVEASKTPIRRHVKIKGQAHPFDPQWTDYLNTRKTISKLQRKVPRHDG
ncbi:MAG: RNA-directed DNA polymerase [Leptospirillum rubarum]|nr:MAG: RNA-directed DNA polymerase [Leptospirillum rubarum]